MEFDLFPTPYIFIYKYKNHTTGKVKKFLFALTNNLLSAINYLLSAINSFPPIIDKGKIESIAPLLYFVGNYLLVIANNLLP